jgi:hypothetical protein
LSLTPIAGKVCSGYQKLSTSKEEFFVEFADEWLCKQVYREAIAAYEAKSTLECWFSKKPLFPPHTTLGRFQEDAPMYTNRLPDSTLAGMRRYARVPADVTFQNALS